MASSRSSSPSSSSASSVELEIDVGDVDDSICIVCNGTTYIGQTIACETCMLWFHFQCVGVKDGDDVVEKEDVPFYCPKCVQKQKHKGRKAAANKVKVKAKKKKKAKPAASKKAAVASAPPLPPPPSPMGSPPIKLKISLGGAPASSPSPVTPTKTTPRSSSKSLPKSQLSMDWLKKRKSSSSSSPSTNAATASISPAPTTSRSASSARLSEKAEEERWLDAVEAGDVNLVDPELKSIKDPKLMTARQRAMAERQLSAAAAAAAAADGPASAAGDASLDSTVTANQLVTLEDSGHMSLDYGYKKKSEADSEEALREKALKSRKRKEVELEKREQDKKRTMDRLLKKKDSKATKQIKTAKPSQRNVPTIRYRLDRDGPSLSFPTTAQTFPLEATNDRSIPKVPEVVRCSVDECENPKKYNCSKSGKPLCSLECYRKNQSLLQAV